VRLPELQDCLLKVLRRLVAMLMRGTTLLNQRGYSGLPIPAQPDITGLVGDRIPLAELGHCAFAELVLKYQSRPFANAKRKALAGTETVKSVTRATRCRFDDAKPKLDGP